MIRDSSHTDPDIPATLGASVPALPLAVHSHGQTDPGRVRTTNEDQFMIAELAKALRVRQSSLPLQKTQYGDERGYLFLVADGMGGHQGGEHASALAVDTIEGFALNTLRRFVHLDAGETATVLSDFKAALARADARMFEAAAEHPELRGMGTTVTLAYAIGAALFVVHVGDSRGYLMRGGALFRLTHDHTLVTDLVRAGQIAPEQAKHHSLRNIVTNVVGGNEAGVKVEIHKIELEAGDLLLLCSDGLTEMLSDDEVAEALRTEPDPGTLCRRLVSEANAKGGRDNITVVIARFESLSPL